ncbi:MAG: hypothetical protein JST85_08770 [Acidobacteria bacterium]|nr:hypothetical protein [Acidobacteriota bacterium]
MNDTSPEIAQMVRERMLARSSDERLQMGSQMFDVARKMILASFPPGLNDMEIKRRLCERLYGDEVDVEDFVANLEARMRQTGPEPQTKQQSDQITE